MDRALNVPDLDPPNLKVNKFRTETRSENLVN